MLRLENPMRWFIQHAKGDEGGIQCSQGGTRRHLLLWNHNCHSSLGPTNSVEVGTLSWSLWSPKTKHSSPTRDPDKPELVLALMEASVEEFS